MGDKTKIEWADATWNPVTGCSKISAGCDRCYIDRSPPFRIEGRAFRVECPDCDGLGVCVACRNSDMSGGCPAAGGCCRTCEGTGGVRSDAIGATTGVRLHPDRLDQPLRWRRPRKVFVCSLADLFHDEVPDSYIASVFAVMASSPAHTFQVLTKRPARLRSLLSRSTWPGEVMAAAEAMGLDGQRVAAATWPLPNVWIGVTVENQEWARLRIPILLETPAAVRFLSVEPMVGAVDLEPWLNPAAAPPGSGGQENRGREGTPGAPGRCGIDWVICGGESGTGARPMDPAWAATLRDQCAAAGVAYLFKQWGEWAPAGTGVGQLGEKRQYIGESFSVPGSDVPVRQVVERVGKRAAGRDLQGRTWDEYPKTAS